MRMMLLHGVLTLSAIAAVWLPAGRAVAAAGHEEPRTGPTLTLRYDGQEAPNTIADFMYFVPILSPVAIGSHTSASNTQRIAMTELRKTRDGETFHIVCGFVVRGEGHHENAVIFDDMVRSHRDQLDRGETLPHVLDAICIDGGGRGRLEVDGVSLAEGDRVDSVTVCFTDGKAKSPVHVALCDVVKDGDAYVKCNEMRARVSSLTFHRTEETPHMEIQLVSLVRKGAREGLWSRLKGSLVNLFIPPIRITSEGNDVMLALGAALDVEAASFTFPFARNLR